MRGYCEAELRQRLQEVAALENSGSDRESGEEEEEDDDDDFYEDVEGEAEAEAEDEDEVEEGTGRHLIHLIAAKAKPLDLHSELSVAAAPPASTRYNDQLLLEAGYLWDDLSCASVPLRFQVRRFRSPHRPRPLLTHAWGLPPHARCLPLLPLRLQLDVESVPEAKTRRALLRRA